MENRKNFSWSDFDPLCIARFVLKHIWLAVLSALIAVMGVYLLQNLVLTPSYTSTTTFAVTSRSASTTSVGSIAATDTVSEQFAQLLQSSIVRTAAAEEMGLSSFPGEFYVNVPENTNILNMSITADTPELAFQCALAIIDCYPAYSEFILSSAILEPINGPSIPSAPNDMASRSRLLKLSAPLGALLVIAILILMSMRADTVQTVSGAKRQIDGKLLATIHHEQKSRTLKSLLSKKKKSLLISDPTCSFYYTETIHQLRAQIEHDAEKNQSQVFMVTSCGENEGKSTVAANLALSLAQKHSRVLLVDADLRKPAQNLIFETTVSRERDLGALIREPFSRSSLKHAVLYDKDTNLHTLYAMPLRGMQAEVLSIDSFRLIFSALRDAYDYIIVDTPPYGFFADAEVIGEIADASLLVVRQDTAPAIAINDAIDDLSNAHARFLGFVLNNLRTSHTGWFRSNGYGYGYGYGYGKAYGKEASRYGRKGASR